MIVEKEYTVYDIVSGELVRVTAVNANHCPASVMFLFQFNCGKSILHTGDMRYDPNVMHHSCTLRSMVGNLDDLFLDTTYCNEKYQFPSQDLIFKHVDGIVREFACGSKENALVMVGSYSLGKEKLVHAVLRAWPESLVFAATRRYITRINPPTIKTPS
jgi:DNA cross-link repair 1A protein